MGRHKKQPEIKSEESETPAGCTPKKVPISLLPKGHEMYGWWAKVVENTSAFDHLRGVRVAFFWRMGWRKTPDRPPRMVHVQKMSDMVRSLTGNAKEMGGVDFCVYLNFEEFQKEDAVPVKVRDAWLDYAACQMGRAYNRQGEPAEDELGRPVWRTIKPDMIFSECIARRGFFQEEVKSVARAIEHYKQPHLWEEEPGKDSIEEKREVHAKKIQDKARNGKTPRADA